MPRSDYSIEYEVLTGEGTEDKKSSLCILLSGALETALRTNKEQFATEVQSIVNSSRKPWRGLGSQGKLQVATYKAIQDVLTAYDTKPSDVKITHQYMKTYGRDPQHAADELRTWRNCTTNVSLTPTWMSEK